MIVKAPFNYIGDKYRIINSIQEFFPENIDTFVDLFCGGCDVSINTDANNVYANDINYHVIGILKEFQKYDVDYILEYIDSTIEKWQLSKTNESVDIRLFVATIIKQRILWIYMFLCVSVSIISLDSTAVTIIIIHLAEIEVVLTRLCVIILSCSNSR